MGVFDFRVVYRSEKFGVKKIIELYWFLLLDYNF